MKPPKRIRFPQDSLIFKEHRFLKKAFSEVELRTPLDECLLCKREKAEKKSSHIFPDFFTKSIFIDEKKRRLYGYSSNEPTKVASTTAKEDYIFCPQCEGRLGALERLIALRLPATIAALRERGIAPGVVFEIVGIAPPLFHLFIYSLLWRAHISRSDEFQWLILGEDEAEELRRMLDQCLSTKKEVMVKEMTSMYPTHLPLYYQMATANQMPRGQYKIIVADGHEYSGLPGYCLNVSDFFIGFHSSNEPKEVVINRIGANSPVDILSMSIKQWEGLIDERKKYIRIRVDTFIKKDDESSPLRPGLD